MSDLNEPLEITIKGNNNISNLIFGSEQSVIENAKKQSLENQLVVVEKRPRNYKTTHKGILRDPESVELIPEDENNKALIPPILDFLKEYVLENDYIMEEVKISGKCISYKSDSIRSRYDISGRILLNEFVNEEGYLGIVNSEEDIDTLYDYTTVAYVIYPKNRKKFSGTIISDHHSDSYIGWQAGQTIREIIRENHCLIVNAITPPHIEKNEELGIQSTYNLEYHKTFNPERYKDLDLLSKFTINDNPGGNYALDLLTQTTKGVENYLKNKDYIVNNRIATGTSGGSFYLKSYMNIVHPIVNYFDGIFDDGYIDTGPQIIRSPARQIFYFTRYDINIPVIYPMRSHTIENWQYYYGDQSEFIGLEEKAEYFINIPNSINSKTLLQPWYMHGLGGFPDTVYKKIDNKVYTNDPYLQVLGIKPEKTVYGLQRSNGTYENDGPNSQLMKAMLNQLVNWSKYGIVPKTNPLFEYEIINDKVKIKTDEIGFSKGGIRVAHVRVPLRFFNSGNTIPIEKKVLQSLYSSVDDFVEKFTKAINEDVKNGWILEADKQYTIDEQTEIAKILLA